MYHTVRRHSFGKYANINFTLVRYVYEKCFSKNPKTKNMISDLKLRYFHLNNMINLRKLIVPNCTASQFGKYANTILRELDMCMKNTFAKNPSKKHDFGFEITIFPFK